MTKQHVLVLLLLVLTSSVRGLPQYYLVNVQNDNVLDANTAETVQYDGDYPRPFLAWNDTADSQLWTIVESAASGFYLLKSFSTGLCLDGNDGPAQFDYYYVVPFLWTCTPDAPNQQWSLQLVQDSSNYMIVNNQNTLALDGNDDPAIPQQDPSFPNPFLWTSTPSASNQQWSLVLSGNEVYSLPTAGGSFQPCWWLGTSESITACSLGGPSCTVNGQYSITVGPASAGTSGTLTVTVNDGEVAFNYIYYSEITVPCTHGTVIDNACVCDYGWQGSDCNTVWVITLPLGGATITPLTFLATGSSYTTAEIYTGLAWAPYIPLTEGPNQQITIPSQQSLAYTADEDTMVIVLSIDGQNELLWPFQFTPSCSSPCFHGLCDASAESCTCETGWTGTDCNTPICDPPCSANGRCVQASLTENQCQCGAAWVGETCNLFKCNCDNVDYSNDALCSCTSIACTYTRSPYPGTYPGWEQELAYTQDCIPGPDGYPIPFAGQYDSSEDWMDDTNDAANEVMELLLDLLGALLG